MSLAAFCGLMLAIPASAGGPGDQGGFKVLPAIVRGNLAIFPVVANHSYDTSQLMTLDEGVRSGQVTVTEAGDERGLIRPGQAIPRRQEGAEVNRLVLYNNSSHPLLLLAGEIVTGGKQDRVIGPTASFRRIPDRSISASSAWSRGAGWHQAPTLARWARRWLNRVCARRRWPSAIKARFGQMSAPRMQRWLAI